MRTVVIGSGVAGASTAYHLSRLGAEVVIVDAASAIEQRRSGAATSAGAGIVSPWTSRGPDDPLAFKAAAYYPSLVDQLATDGQHDSSFEVVGGIVVSPDGAGLDDVLQRIRLRATANPAVGAVSRLDSADTRELFPVLGPRMEAVYITGAGRVDGRKLRGSLLDACAARGVRLLDGEAELARQNGSVTGVRAGGEYVAADTVVVAAGAWSAELLEPLGVRLGVTPQRGQISHFGLAGTSTASWPVVLAPEGHYMLAFPDSRVVAGATREAGVGFAPRVTAAGQHEILSHALDVAPGLGQAQLLETRVGLRPVSTDGAPLLGRIEAHPEVVVATGFGPAGLTVGPYAGKLVADLVTGGQPAVDLKGCS